MEPQSKPAINTAWLLLLIVIIWGLVGALDQPTDEPARTRSPVARTRSAHSTAT